MPCTSVYQIPKILYIQLFNFWFLGRGGGEREGRVAEKVGLHFYFTGTYEKRCIEGLEILEVRIYDQTMVEAVN